MLSVLLLFLTACTDADKDSLTSDTAAITDAVTEVQTLPVGIRSDKPTSRDMYEGSAEKEALQVPKGETAGFRFSVNAPFDRLTVCCPSWSDDIGTMRFSLFAWEKNHDITVSGAVLATELYVD